MLVTMFQIMFGITQVEALIFILSIVFSGIIFVISLKYIKKIKLNFSETLTAEEIIIDDLEIKKPTDRKSSQRLNELLLNREILSYTITRLYEAEIKGDITEDGRDEMVTQHEEKVTMLNSEITQMQRYNQLEELEEQSSTLTSSVSKRIKSIQQEIDKVRLEAGLKPTIKKSNESDKTQDVEQKTKPEMTQVMKNVGLYIPCIWSKLISYSLRHISI